MIIKDCLCFAIIAADGIESVPVQGYANLYGNNVQLRDTIISTGNLNTYVDFDKTLRSGLLEYYLLYAHPSSQIKTLRIQIWRPSNDSTNAAYLVWERRVRANSNVSVGALNWVSRAFAVRLSFVKCMKTLE